MIYMSRSFEYNAQLGCVICEEKRFVVQINLGHLHIARWVLLKNKLPESINHFQLSISRLGLTIHVKFLSVRTTERAGEGWRFPYIIVNSIFRFLKILPIYIFLTLFLFYGFKLST